MNEIRMQYPITTFDSIEDTLYAVMAELNQVLLASRLGVGEISSKDIENLYDFVTEGIKYRKRVAALDELIKINQELKLYETTLLPEEVIRALEE